MSEYDPIAHHCWLEIDLSQWKRNIKAIQELANVPVLVVVKANAYGHGLVACCQAAEEAGVRMLGVVTSGEAALLRQAGIKTDILRMAAWLPEDLPFLIEHEIDFLVSDKNQIQQIQAQAKASGRHARVQIKVDSGMGRLGIFPGQALELAALISQQADIDFRGIYTHFHTSEADDPAITQAQIDVFDGVLAGLKAQSLMPPLVHAANSEGLLRFPHAHYTMVRSGIITYGVPFIPDGDLPDAAMGPVAQWKARIVSLKRLPAGHGVGYGIEYKTEKEETIAIIPVGYGDGLRRMPADINEFLISGRIVKTVGRICMDQCMVVIPDDLDASLGDEVVIIGRQEDQRICARALSQRWGTNRRDVFTGILPRVPRIYK